MFMFEQVIAQRLHMSRQNNIWKCGLEPSAGCWHAYLRVQSRENDKNITSDDSSQDANPFVELR